MPSITQRIHCSTSSFWTNDLTDFVPSFVATSLADPQRLLVATASQELRVYDAAEDGSTVLRAAVSAQKRSPAPGWDGVFSSATPDPREHNTWWTSRNGMTEGGTPLLGFTRWRFREDSPLLLLENNSFLENGTRILHEGRNYDMDRVWDVDFLDGFGDARQLVFSGVFSACGTGPSRAITVIGVVMPSPTLDPTRHHVVLHAHLVFEEHLDRQARTLLLSVDRWSRDSLIYTINRSTRRVSVLTYSSTLMRFSEQRSWSVGARFVEVFDMAVRDDVVAIAGMRPDGRAALDLYDGNGVLQATMPFASERHFTGIAFANSPAITAQHPRGAWLWRLARSVSVDVRADFDKRNAFLNRYHLVR